MLMCRRGRMCHGRMQSQLHQHTGQLSVSLSAWIRPRFRPTPLPRYYCYRNNCYYRYWLFSNIVTKQGMTATAFNRSQRCWGRGPHFPSGVLLTTAETERWVNSLGSTVINAARLPVSLQAQQPCSDSRYYYCYHYYGTRAQSRGRYKHSLWVKKVWITGCNRLAGCERVLKRDRVG